MASQNINPELAVRLGDLREKHGDSVKVEDISAVVESMMATMKLQKKLALPYPSGCSSVAGFLERLIPSSNSS